VTGSINRSFEPGLQEEAIFVAKGVLLKNHPMINIIKTLSDVYVDNVIVRRESK
jgi:hypothetical protein